MAILLNLVKSCQPLTRARYARGVAKKNPISFHKVIAKAHSRVPTC